MKFAVMGNETFYLLAIKCYIEVYKDVLCAMYKKVNGFRTLVNFIKLSNLFQIIKKLNKHIFIVKMKLFIRRCSNYIY